MFGVFANVWAFSSAFAAQTASDGANVSLVTLLNFYHSYADWGILRTCWQMASRQALPRKKPVHSIARGCFHTAGRVWGVSSGSVTLFVSCEYFKGRDCMEDAFQGVWGQPTWLHRWMTVRPWAMCLLGAFCSGRDASSMIAVDGTSDAY